MKKNSLHFLVSFTSKHIELEQGNSVMVKKNEIIYKLKSTPSFCKNTMLLQTIHPWEKSMTEIFVSLLFG